MRCFVLKRTLNFGSLNIDTVYSVAEIVRPGETILATKIESFCGGKGFNQSIAYARAGGKIFHAGRIGVDGDMLKAELVSNGVNCDNLALSPNKSGSAIIQRSNCGQNSIILYGGSNLEITQQAIDNVLTTFSSSDVLICQNEISQIPYLIRSAYEKEMEIIFNPSPIGENITDDLLNKISWLIINEIEGYELTQKSNPNEILMALSERYPQMKIVLTLGENGAVCADKDRRYSQPSYSIPVVDTTGAGDTFLGYFVSSIINGANIPTALEIASAAAAIAVSVAGALPSIPLLDDVKLFLKESLS